MISDSVLYCFFLPSASEVPKDPPKDKGVSKGDSAVELAGVGLREIGDELLCIYSVDRNAPTTRAGATTGRMDVGTNVTGLVEDEVLLLLHRCL